MIGAENETGEHDIDNLILFEPAFECNSSDKAILNDGIGLEPGPNDLCDDLNCRSLRLFAKDYLNLIEQLFFTQLSELVEIKILSYKVHYDLLWLRTAHRDS